jgi:hypothetical protein
MTSSRSLRIGVAFASLVSVVVPLLLSRSDVSAQATHAGTFSVAAGGGNTIYATRAETLFAAGLLAGDPNQQPPENVLVTICPTSGVVELRIDGHIVDSSITRCFTRNHLVVRGVSLVGKPDATGTYSVSVNLLPPAAPPKK